MRSALPLWFSLMISTPLLLATSPTQAQYANNEAVVTYAAEVPPLDCDGVPCVAARTADGRSWKFAIDTGNENSVISAQVAQMAGRKKGSQTRAEVTRLTPVPKNKRCRPAKHSAPGTPPGRFHRTSCE